MGAGIMEVPAEPKRFVRFGEFELDIRTAELRSNGNTLVLQQKPFRVLVALLQKQGDMVSRQELAARVWPAGADLDFELSLNKAVNRLREALNDSAEQPRFIETLPRKGYRFIGPLEPGAVIGPSVPEARVQTKLAPIRHRAKVFILPIAVSAVLIVAGILIGKSAFRQPTPGPQSIRSLAVLPLENLSGDPSQDYFADGMTDELITSLGQLPSLRVISRTSVIQYKGTRKPLPQIARELKVDAIVEGTAVRAGSRVRITAQLIQASTDKHLWAKSYEGDVQDSLGLQAQVANAIAEEIRLKFTTPLQSVAGRRPINAEAYEAYLKGRYFWNRRDGGGLEKAIEYYQRAVQLDPGYAPAYAGLAQSYVLLAGSHADILDNTVKGKAAAEHALQLDPSLAEAHTALALLTLHDWNFAEAEREYRLAVALAPNYATAHHWYGDGFLVLMGRFDETNREMKQAIALDPVSRIIATDWGQVLRFERCYDDAYVALSQVLEMDPGFSEAYNERGLTLLHQRKFAAAIADLEAAKRIDNTPRRLALLAYGYGLAGQEDRARMALRELQSFGGSAYVGSWAEAIVHIGLGENDNALNLLDKAIQERSADCIAFKVDPIYDPLRTDPRFRDLVRRTGLPQ